MTTLDNPAAAVQDHPAESERHRLEQYRVFRDYIEHEDELINQRTTWAVTIQGFLFAAYALVLQSHADFEASVLGSRLPDAVWQNPSPRLLMFAAIVIFPTTGAMIAVLSWISIRAARRAVDRLERDYARFVFKVRPGDAAAIQERFYRRDPVLPGLTGGGERLTARRGWVLAYSIPLGFVLVWLSIALITGTVAGWFFR